MYLIILRLMTIIVRRIWILVPPLQQVCRERCNKGFSGVSFYVLELVLPHFV
jgi:hypothetical protein